MSFLTKSPRITNPSHQQEQYDPKHTIKTKDFKKLTTYFMYKLLKF